MANAINKPMARKLWVAGGFAVALGVGAWCFYDGASVDTENAYIKAEKYSLAPEVGGVVTEVLVRANQTVARSAYSAVFGNMIFLPPLQYYTLT